MSNSCLSPAAQTPILLDKEHHLAALIVTDAHRRVMQGDAHLLVGLRETIHPQADSWLCCLPQAGRKTMPRKSSTTSARVSCSTVSAVSDHRSGFCWPSLCEDVRHSWKLEGMVVSVYMLLNQGCSS